jgi:hypothetical protein
LKDRIRPEGFTAATICPTLVILSEAKDLGDDDGSHGRRSSHFEILRCAQDDEGGWGDEVGGMPTLNSHPIFQFSIFNFQFKSTQ